MSVIVPMRNAAEHVLEQVTALANQSVETAHFEVIWVDNGSSDGTLQLVAEAIRGYKRCVRFRQPEVRSSYFARNRELPWPSGPTFSSFCDADDVVDKRWVQSMATCARRTGRRRWLPDADSITPAVAAGVFFGFLPAAPTANLGIRRTRSRG